MAKPKHVNDRAAALIRRRALELYDRAARLEESSDLEQKAEATLVRHRALGLYEAELIVLGKITLVKGEWRRGK